MNRFRVEVLVVPRPGLLDPQGKAVHHALSSLGWDSVVNVRVGKAIHLDVDADSADSAVAAVHEMCRKLLANPVTEDYRVTASAPLRVTDGASLGTTDGAPIDEHGNDGEFGSGGESGDGGKHGSGGASAARATP